MTAGIQLPEHEIQRLRDQRDRLARELAVNLAFRHDREHDHGTAFMDCEWPCCKQGYALLMEVRGE